ncbi:uncharacterized protein J4E78_006812 [Alternaria triticimaculans]|uniref:uncharacterized protein n=1 Tax=Alternaria triticimaculans TaxID=297637 RepID=UPI0020C2AAA6|nr:uncharacterized protein J4E78_006812 [Alternaria triticimaculans]KAI4656921.1 hypothetical protein J4E78_006812 [Alternaria triticimaculans]
MATMEPNIDKDKLPSEAESDETRQGPSTVDMDELNRILRKSVDEPPRARHQFSPGTAVLLIFYTLVHIAFIQPVSLILGRQFLVPIVFMLLIKLTATTYLEEVVKMYDKYIDHIKDLASLSLELAHKYEEAAQENGEAFRMFHQEANEMRLRYYQAYLSHYQTLIDYIEPIVRKVKTLAAPPKVKGARRNGCNRNKNDNNALTDTLEDFAAAIKQRQTTTRLQIAVAEKIKDILDREGLLPEEIDRLVDEAEEDLERAQEASVTQTQSPGSGTSSSIALSSPVVESVDSKLEKHFGDLDRWFQSVRDQPVVAEEN